MSVFKMILVLAAGWTAIRDNWRFGPQRSRRSTLGGHPQRRYRYIHLCYFRY